MFHSMLLFALLFAVGAAQEHLTCIRTESVLTPSAPPNPRTQQGAPGKRGPMGLKGDNGLRGPKGEPGVPDNSTIEALKDELRTLQGKYDTLRAESLRGYITLDDGWIAPFNGYQYKVTPSRQNWEGGRQTCRSWGGDLAVYGVIDMGVRGILVRVFSPRSNERLYIGASDTATEGRFVWVNGLVVTNDVMHWRPGQPDDAGRNEDCVEIISSVTEYQILTNDQVCSYRLLAICEKPV